MTRVLAGIYGRPAPADVRRLEAVVGRGGTVDTAEALAVGWSEPLDSALAGYGCAIDGRIEAPEPGDGDAAAIAAAYGRAGRAVLGTIRGHFTLAVWDRESGDGLLAVDQLGASPLYTAEDGGRLFFASEIRDLLRLLPRTPDPEPRYLAYYIGGESWPEDLTPYTGIRRLPGGHAVDLRDGSWRTGSYWELRYVEPSRLDRSDAVAALRTELGRAVAKRLAPGHSGIFLSGGLDSTAVAGVARGLAGETLHAYSGVFPAHEQSDESRLLEEVTQALELPWTKAVARRASVLRNSLTYLREWRVPSIVPNLYFLLPLLHAAEDDGVRVMLDGEGGDELFGCVAYAAADRLRGGNALGALGLVRRLPWEGQVQPWNATYHLLKRFAVRGALPYGAHHLRRRRPGDGLGGAPWLSDSARTLLAAERDLWAWKRADGPRWWAYLADLVTRGRIRFGLLDTMRRLGEMTGVERRHPFLDDLDLIELVLSFPPELAFDVRYTRPLLRDAIAGLVPDGIRLRTQKADFRFPIEESFAGPEREVIASLVLAPDARIRPFISEHVAADAVEKVGHPKFIPYQGGLLRMVTAEIWLRSLEDQQFPDRLAERGLPSEDVELVRASRRTSSFAGTPETEVTSDGGRDS